MEHQASDSTGQLKPSVIAGDETADWKSLLTLDVRIFSGPAILLLGMSCMYPHD